MRLLLPLVGFLLVWTQIEAEYCPLLSRNPLTGAIRTPEQRACEPCDQLFDPKGSFMLECGQFVNQFILNKLKSSCTSVVSGGETNFENFVKNLLIFCENKGYPVTDNLIMDDCGCDICDLIFGPGTDFMVNCGFGLSSWEINALISKCETAECGTLSVMRLENFIRDSCRNAGFNFKFPQCECNECYLLFDDDSEFMQGCGASMTTDKIEQYEEACAVCMDDPSVIFDFMQDLRSTCESLGQPSFTFPVCDCDDVCFMLFDQSAPFYERCFSTLSNAEQTDVFKDCKENYQAVDNQEGFVQLMEDWCLGLSGISISTPSCNNCPLSNFDIIVVMDSSGSISQTNHALQKDFMNEVACSFDISDDKTRFGLVEFGTNAAIRNPLDVKNSKPEVSTDIQNTAVCTLGCSTNTPAGLDLMSGMFNTMGSTNEKVGLVLTDGHHNEGNLGNAVAGIPSDVTMYAVGVDKADPAELLMIAGGNAARVFNVAESAQLSSIIDSLRQELCNGDGTTPYDPAP